VRKPILNESSNITGAVASSLLDEVRHLHSELKLCGEPRNALLYVPDDLLSYILFLLRDECPAMPEASSDEWTDLLTRLSFHSILPLVYRKIGQLPQEVHPPKHIIQDMRKAFMGSRALCLQMERQLHRLLDAFKEAAVRALVLKGPALVWSVYPDPATRPSSDIDLLVLPEEFTKAREVLHRLGYRCTFGKFEDFGGTGCQETFINQANSTDSLDVELHWELHDFFGVERGNRVYDLFSRSMEVETSIVTFEALNWVDALIHAALHLVMTHNQEVRLLWIYDIALLAQKLTVPDDWKLLQERSSIWGARLSLESSLRMAQLWAGLQIPRGFDRFSAWPKPTEAETTAVINTMLRHSRPDIYLKLFSPGLGSLTIPKKIRLLLRLVFPSTDCMRSRYLFSHKWLLPVFYIRRWWKWFVRIIRIV
jgi:hypothetical protein